MRIRKTKAIRHLDRHIRRPMNIQPRRCAVHYRQTKVIAQRLFAGSSIVLNGDFQQAMEFL